MFVVRGNRISNDSKLAFNENSKKPYCTHTRNFFMENKNGHETDFYKAKRRIDDTNLHKKTGRIQLE